MHSGPSPMIKTIVFSLCWGIHSKEYIHCIKDLRMLLVENTYLVGCRAVVADICFVIDSSGSINEVGDNYRVVKNFLNRVINSLDVSETGVHIGAVRFSDSARLIWGLDRYYSKKEQIKAVNEMGYVGGFTNTQRGLEVMI